MPSTTGPGALFGALARRFERFEAGAHSYNVNNIARGLEHLELTLVGRSTAGSSDGPAPTVTGSDVITP